MAAKTCLWIQAIFFCACFSNSDIRTCLYVLKISRTIEIKHLFHFKAYFFMSLTYFLQVAFVFLKALSCKMNKVWNFYSKSIFYFSYILDLVIHFGSNRSTLSNKITSFAGCITPSVKPMKTLLEIHFITASLILWMI